MASLNAVARQPTLARDLLDGLAVQVKVTANLGDRLHNQHPPARLRDEHRGGRLPASIGGQNSTPIRPSGGHYSAPIHTFDEETAKFNPLEFVRGWDDARILADLLIVSEGRADPFWDRSARDLMTGLIWFVKETRPAELQNMREIARLASPSRAEKSDLLEALRESGDEKLVELANSIENWHDGMEASIYQSLRSHLDVWRSEEIAKATDETTDDLEEPGDILHRSYFEEYMALKYG